MLEYLEFPHHVATRSPGFVPVHNYNVVTAQLTFVNYLILDKPAATDPRKTMSSQPPQNAVDITTLSVQQLSALQARLSQELEHLTTSYQRLRAAQARFKDCIRSIQQGVQGKSGGEQNTLSFPTARKDTIHTSWILVPEKDDHIPRRAGGHGLLPTQHNHSTHCLPETPLLIPLTTSLYVPGTLAAPTSTDSSSSSSSTVLVDIGTGFFVEKTPEDGIKFYTGKVDDLGKNLLEIEKAVGGKNESLRSWILSSFVLCLSRFYYDVSPGFAAAFQSTQLNPTQPTWGSLLRQKMLAEQAAGYRSLVVPIVPCASPLSTLPFPRKHARPSRALTDCASSSRLSVLTNHGGRTGPIDHGRTITLTAGTCTCGELVHSFGQQILQLLNLADELLEPERQSSTIIDTTFREERCDGSDPGHVLACLDICKFAHQVVPFGVVTSLRRSSKNASVSLNRHFFTVISETVARDHLIDFDPASEELSGCLQLGNRSMRHKIRPHHETPPCHQECRLLAATFGGHEVEVFEGIRSRLIAASIVFFIFLRFVWCRLAMQGWKIGVAQGVLVFESNTIPLISSTNKLLDEVQHSFHDVHDILLIVRPNGDVLDPLSVEADVAVVAPEAIGKQLRIDTTVDGTLVSIICWCAEFQHDFLQRAQWVWSTGSIHSQGLGLLSSPGVFLIRRVYRWDHLELGSGSTCSCRQAGFLPACDDVRLDAKAFRCMHIRSRFRPSPSWL
ncbi:hypothetical protein KCU88_g12, partial [Aureobasidium melanogenum]